MLTILEAFCEKMKKKDVTKIQTLLLYCFSLLYAHICELYKVSFSCPSLLVLT